MVFFIKRGKKRGLMQQDSTSNFFDKYPEFYQSQVSAFPNRLNNRFRALIENNISLIKDKKILDLARQVLYSVF